MALSGLVVDDPVAWARKRGAELVDFAAPRGPRMTSRAWLETVAAIDDRRKRDGAALVDAIVRRAGLSAFANVAISSLAPFARAALAVAETAVAIARAPEKYDVVVPEPPIAWPHRHDLRRVAVELLAGANVFLHARDAAELAPLIDRAAIVDGAGRALAPSGGQRALIVRVYGWGEPYDAFRKALDALGVTVAGGPIAHVLTAPEAVGAREVLAAAFDAGLDVLEVREAML
jgi:hypothetical protein